MSEIISMRIISYNWFRLSLSTDQHMMSGQHHPQ